MSFLHWFALALALVVVAVLGVLFGVTWIENYQARHLKAGGVDIPVASDSKRNAVIYFSRSGNTALAARHLATQLDARLVELQASEYELGIAGLTNALKDANALKSRPQALPDIVPRTIDLSSYDTVYLGSPIWLYSPAPPIWAFMKSNRFDGNHVVLFNTFNSNFSQERIESFRSKVISRGAKSFVHLQIRRGRMTQQKTPDEMLKAIDTQWMPIIERP
ncbi:flavodoxin family protein [Microbulbifer pacificus]|uniref:Flavodoxin n=1 Tax=Microbulbifer pacificus TaxID=407164 RepID=A0AAU0MX90_9GAMM|nr:flavodoxin [Microbulbifer pacificus]WOX04630.1 flavodoxin [Microbulbifer pacificus]